MRVVIALALSLTSLGVPSLVAGQTTSSTLLVGDKAYLLLPPRFVSQASAAQLKWSPDGRQLAVVRMHMPLKASEMRSAMMTGKTPADFESRQRVFVDVYDAESEQTKQALELPFQTGVEMAWMAESNQLFVLTTRHVEPKDGGLALPAHELHRFDPRSGRTARIGAFQSYVGAGMSLSPTRSLGLIWLVGRDGTEEAIAVTATGVSQPAKIAGGPGPYGAYLAWNADGLRVKMGRRTEGPEGAGKWLIHELDPTTLTATLSTDTRMAFQEDGRTLTWSQAATEVRVSAKEQEKLPATVLTPVQPGDNDKAAVLDAFVEQVEVSPDSKRVAYTHHGMTLVRELVEVPRAMYEQMREAARRTAALSNAKQVALAAIMFSADNNDRLPSNKEDVQKLLMPYLRNQSILDGFVYTFAGGFINDVANPSETELGFISMPGGRIVAYVDGHVKWVSDGRE